MTPAFRHLGCEFLGGGAVAWVMYAAWVTEMAEGAGYAGFFVLMVLENLIPPIPMEVILSLGGMAAARGELSLPLLIAACGAGGLLGTLFWYAVGYWLGRERLKRWVVRHGRWVALTPEELSALHLWFERYGRLVVSVGRALPWLGTLVSVPAGMSRMPFRTFLIYSALFFFGWPALVMGAGYWVGEQVRAVQEWLTLGTAAALVLLLGWYVWRVVTFGRR